MALPDTRIRSLEAAREGLALGASPRTLGYITGLPETYIRREIFVGLRPPRGRPAYSEELLFRGSLRVRADVGVFASNYLRLRSSFEPTRSLIEAYRHERSRSTTGASFCFDQAFYLASHLDGRWISPEATLDLATCPTCSAPHVVPSGFSLSELCSTCKAELRLATSQPVSINGRARIPRLSVPASTEELDQVIARAKYERRLQDLGAHPRLVHVLSAISAPVKGEFTTVTSRAYWKDWRGKPLPLYAWCRRVKPLARVQYSILAITFRRLRFAGFSPEESLETAFKHARDGYLPADSIVFDRAFEVISKSEGLWGVDRQGLKLERCGSCGSLHLISTEDRARRPSCPFCHLLRRPDIFVDARRDTAQLMSFVGQDKCQLGHRIPRDDPNEVAASVSV